MVRSTEPIRRHLTARSVLIVFGFQLALLIASAVGDIPLSFDDAGVFDTLLLLVITEARLVNAFIDYLLFSSSYVGDLDLALGLLALPIVYYVTAVVVAVPGRAAYRFGRSQLAR